MNGFLRRHYLAWLRLLPFAFHHLNKIVEQVVGIVRAGAGFGVILDAEQRKLRVAESLRRVVVQVDVGKLNREVLK